MKKWALIGCLVLLVAGFSGCIPKVENKLYIYPDGSGKASLFVSVDTLATIEAARGFGAKETTGTDTGQTPSESSGPAGELEKWGVAGISNIDIAETVYLSDILKIKETDAKEKTRIIKELVWEKKDGLYHFRFVPDMSDESSSESPASSGQKPESAKNNPVNKDTAYMMLQETKLSFVLVMPGKVVKSNGKANGREVRWDFTLDDLTNKKNLVFEAFSETSCPELNEEFKKFKEESSAANKRLKEARY